MTLEQNLAEAHKILGALRLVETGHIRKALFADECRRVIQGLEAWARERGAEASPRQAESARLARDSVRRVLLVCAADGGAPEQTP